MNIFMCSASPTLCAQALDDKRLNKMTVETGQILSTTMHWYYDTYKVVLPPPYKRAYPNHPCCVWARLPENYHWLCLYLKELGLEYKYRFGKDHATLQHIKAFESIIPDIKNDGPSNVTNPTCFSAFAPFSGYAEFKCQWTLNFKWRNDKRPPTWTKRGKPAWANFERPLEAAHKHYNNLNK